VEFQFDKFKEYILIGINYVILFQILIYMTRKLFVFNGTISLFFIPLGLSLAFVLYFGIRYLPFILINPLINTIISDRPIIVILLLPLIRMFSVGLGSYFLLYRIKVDLSLIKLKDMSYFIFTSIFISITAGSLSSLLYSYSNILTGDILNSMIDWILGDLIGILTVAPIFIIYVFPRLCETVEVLNKFNKQFQSEELLGIMRLERVKHKRLKFTIEIIIISIVFFFNFLFVSYYIVWLVVIAPMLFITFKHGNLGAVNAIFFMNLTMHFAFNTTISMLRNLEIQLFAIIIAVLILYTGSFVSTSKLDRLLIINDDRNYRTLMNGAPDAIFLYTIEGNFLDVNQRAMDLLEYSYDELLGMNVIDTIPEDQRNVKKPKLATILETYSRTIERQLITKSGKIIDVEISDIKLKDGRLQSIVRDLTQRKEAEKELMESQQQLLHAQKIEIIGKLTSTVAHDFNNLLTIILGYSTRIEKMSNDEGIINAANQINRAAKRSSDLTKQILAFSQKKVIMPEVISVTQILEELLLMLERLLGSNINLRVELHHDLPNIYIDRIQLEQVIMNLIVNAKESINDKGIITITTDLMTKDTIEYVLVSVEDTGIGMSHDTIEKVFTPFFTTKEEGTGLGLSLVHDIVTKNNGYVEFSSELGYGTRFDVLLPSVKEKLIKLESIEIAKLQKNKKGKILLIEDEEGVRILISAMLQDYNYEVLTAENGMEAIEISKKNKDINLIVSDVILPDINGFLVVNECVSFIDKTNVIIMSGHVGDFTKYDLSYQFTFISKPFKINEFLLAVENNLE